MVLRGIVEGSPVAGCSVLLKMESEKDSSNNMTLRLFNFSENILNLLGKGQTLNNVIETQHTVHVSH